MPPTLLLTVFTKRNFVAEFLQVKYTFRQKTDVLRFGTPFGGGWGNVRCSSRLTGKRVMDFLLVLIELFSLDVTAEALTANID